MVNEPIALSEALAIFSWARKGWRCSMLCQACSKSAICHVTEIVAGKPVEYHVCEEHLQELEELKPARIAEPRSGGIWDRVFRDAASDSAARQKLAAFLLPALCLALLDEKPEVRILAVFRLMLLGPEARSTMGALRDALQDADERVRKAASIAAELIENPQNLPWLF
jgi:hypothetical protein